MTTRSGRLLLGLLLLTACSSGGSDGNSDGTSDGNSGAAPAPSGMASCAQATAVGQPVTADLLGRGCADRKGRLVRLSPYICRGTGNLVVTYGRSVAGPLPLALLDGVPASDPPATKYAVWAVAKPGDPSETTDAAGCERGP